MAELSRRPIAGFVASELLTVLGALERIVDEDLARGPVFCEWGSGLGAVTTLASLLSFEAHGIEIEIDLVLAARQLALDLDADATFAHGTFLLPGDEDLVVDAGNLQTDTGVVALRELGLTHAGCDVVFGYPWPGQEQLFDALFMRHTTPGALLMTFHGSERLLVQRQVAGRSELQPLGWM